MTVEIVTVGRPIPTPRERTREEVEAWRAQIEAKREANLRRTLQEEAAKTSQDTAAARARTAARQSAQDEEDTARDLTPDLPVPTMPTTAGLARTPDPTEDIPWQDSGKVPAALAADILAALLDVTVKTTSAGLAEDIGSDATEADIDRLAHYYGWPDRDQVTWALELLTEETPVPTAPAKPKPAPPKPATPVATPAAKPHPGVDINGAGPVLPADVATIRTEAAAALAAEQANSPKTPQAAAELLSRAQRPEHSADVHQAAAAVWDAIDMLAVVMQTERDMAREKLAALERERAALLAVVEPPSDEPKWEVLRREDVAKRPVAQLERPKAKQQRRPAPPAQPSLSKHIRAWAREQGIKVPATGRIAQDVIDAYKAVHP